MYLVLGIGYKKSEYAAVRRKWQQHNIDFHFVRSFEDAQRLLRREVYVCVTVFVDRIAKSIPVEKLHSVQAIPIVLVSENISFPQCVEYLQRSIAEFILNDEQRQDAESCGKDAVQYYLDLPDKGEQKLTAVTTSDVCFCREHRTVDVRGRRIDLTPKEFDILTLLITHPRQVFTFEMTLQLLWGEEYTDASRQMLWNHVSHLRRKMKVEPDMQNHILSVRGIGYKYNP